LEEIFKIEIGRIGRVDKSASGEPIRNSKFEIGRSASGGGDW